MVRLAFLAHFKVNRREDKVLRLRLGFIRWRKELEARLRSG
jgi:hypothetical protein